MTHVDEDFLHVPAHLNLGMSEEGAPAALDDIRLLIKGQGTIGFQIAELSGFSVVIRSGDWGAPGFRWEVGFDGLRLNEHLEGQWIERLYVPGAGLDRSPHCPYWFSFDSINRVLRYGKGEMRLGCCIAEHGLPAKPADGGSDPYGWLREARTVSTDAPVRGHVDLWRDPVLIEPPMRVVRHDAITMEDIAHGKLTVPANLTPTCQILYDNVAGEHFRLDTPDFPHFADAIRESIETEGCWCYETLKEKASEFGSYEPDATYLRITLGQNQGESPGIPYVMEIWPVGHYSPVHNHGGANAVIKVLHGAVTVHLYAMLSPHHMEPFATETFETGDVTWISPRLNQIHKLINLGEREPCITIQCYLYAESNDVHWPYFDYVAKSEIANFDPNSDATFLEFKAKMKEEWQARHG